MFIVLLLSDMNYLGLVNMVSHSTVQTVVTFRYELPGITALNFVLQKSLGGGGVASMRADPQVSITLL